MDPVVRTVVLLAGFRAYAVSMSLHAANKDARR